MLFRRDEEKRRDETTAKFMLLTNHFVLKPTEIQLKFSIANYQNT